MSWFARRGPALPEPVLSVVVPAYDVADWIDDCLASLAGQDLTALEIVVVDDGSTDGTARLARRWARRDPRVRVVARENGGLSAARTTGVEHARAPFLTFVDSDDLVRPWAFAAAVEALQASGADYALLPYQQFRDEDAWSPPPPWVADLYAPGARSVVAHDHPEVLAQATAWSKVYRRDFWDRAGLAFRPGVLYEDQEVTARAFAAADRIDLVPGPGGGAYGWRLRSGSITREATARSIGAFFDAITLALDELTAVPGARSARASQVLSNDVPRYLRTLRTVDDAAHRDRLLAGIEALLAEPDLDLTEAPAEARVVYALLDADRAADVPEFVERGGFDLPSLRSDLVDGQPALLFPFADTVPPRTRILSQRQTPVDAVVLRARLDGEGLALTVAAWLRHVDGDEPTLRAWLRVAADDAREFVVTRSAEPIGHRVRTTRASNERSVFDLALADLTGAAGAELVVEVTHRGRTRRDVVTRIDAAGSAAVPQAHGGLALDGTEPWKLARSTVTPWRGTLTEAGQIEVPDVPGEYEVPGDLDQRLAVALPLDLRTAGHSAYLALAGPRRLKVVVLPDVPWETLTVWSQRDRRDDVAAG